MRQRACMLPDGGHPATCIVILGCNDGIALRPELQLLRTRRTGPSVYN